MGKSNFKVVWFFFKPYKLQVMTLFVLSVLVGALEAANVAAVYPILSTAFDTGVEPGNALFSLFQKFADLLPLDSPFLAYCALFLTVAFFAFIAKIVSINFRVRFGAKLVEKNQQEIFSKFVKADYQYFVDNKQGELIYNVASAPQILASIITSITEIMAQVVLSISILVLLFFLSWPGTLLVLMVGLAYYFFTRYLGGRVSYTSGKGELQALWDSTVLLNEVISGIKQVKVFAAGAEWARRFSDILKWRWYHFIRREVWRQLPTPLLMLTLYLAIGIIAVLIKIVAPTSFMDLIPIFGTFAFAVFRLFPIIGTMGVFTMQIMGALPNCEVVYAIRNDELTYIKDGEKELASFNNAVQLDNVSFTYKGRTPILEDVSVTIEKGKTTALVGRSGAGKTTVISLILRLFEPDKGEIKVDGVNIKEYKMASWLGKIGYVSQDTFIFNDTVRNNITFRSDRYSDGEVDKAASYADAHSFIMELPEGYDTQVGDKGLRLSSGQGQRLAVARAMIRKPEVLIFDEATNALDSISEAAVQRAIDEVSQDHTVIVIAHRLSTIINADKIIVLGEGRVLEQGNHEKLMKNKGAYWELYQS